MSLKQAQTVASSMMRAVGEAMAVKEQVTTTSFVSLFVGALIAKYGAWYMDRNDMWKKSDDDDDDDDDD
ncbi:unnamed protein product, partial [Mesorhabditis belari]|uniref:Uncharacterized protein n=1 Tax=Mesorhabditis belari TaxID=2138241 RepID=A0AAF3FBI4_9BILA